MPPPWPDLAWRDDVKLHFPLWGTPEMLAEWPSVRATLKTGQPVSGTVIARAQFGVWLDIGVAFPALLEVIRMKDAGARRIVFDDYPAMSERVEGWICVLGPKGEIGVTQREGESWSVA